MKRMPILLWWKISHRRHLPSLRRYRKASLQSRLDNGNSCKIQTRQRLPSFAKILSPLTFGDEYTGDSLKQAAQKVVESHVNAYKEIEPEFEKNWRKAERLILSNGTSITPSLPFTIAMISSVTEYPRPNIRAEPMACIRIVITQ